MPTQITADLPTLNFPREVDYPTQEDWAAFSAAAELNFGILGGGWSTQMQLWKTEANAMSTELNTNANIAQGLANYQGDWTSQGYTLGQTVSVGEVYYICKLTHATGQNPTDSESLYWNLALGNWSLKADKTEVASKLDKNFSAFTDKTTPIDTDVFPIMEISGLIKKLSWSNIKATLKTYFDTLYATPAYVDGKMVLGTAVNATGTSIDFTGIPTWVKRITLMIKDVSLSGTSSILVQVGKTTIQTTGYDSSSAQGSNGNAPIVMGNFNGFVIVNDVATDRRSYTMEINKISASSYVASYCGGGITGRTIFSVGGGSVLLSDILDRLRITTVNGTDAFDAGQINIIYEG